MRWVAGPDAVGGRPAAHVRTGRVPCQDGRVSEDLDFLVDLLDLEPIEVNIFRGVSPNEERQRVFGGQVAAQSLMAAGRTVEIGHPHSLHAYFLRPGDPNVPILYEVDRIRDGRSFTTRRVVAIQHGRAIFNLSASFHIEEAGLEHELPMPDVPAPEELESLVTRLEPYRDTLGDWFAKPHPIDQRHIGELPFTHKSGKDPRQRLWIRADGTLPDAGPLLHACIAAYASDMSLFDTMLAPHDVNWDDAHFMGASLDHCMWFHRPFRADEWLLYDMDSPTAYGARGLARGFLFSRQGDLVVSVVQEGLMRVVATQHGPAEEPAG
jgi:acyl-CoA thioesterase II